MSVQDVLLKYGHYIECPAGMDVVKLIIAKTDDESLTYSELIQSVCVKAQYILIVKMITTGLIDKPKQIF